MTEGQTDTSNKDNSNSNRNTVSSLPSSAYNNKLENVLILQGGAPWERLAAEYSKHLQIIT